MILLLDVLCLVLESELSALQIHSNVTALLTAALTLYLTMGLLPNTPATASSPAGLFNASAHPGAL